MNRDKIHNLKTDLVKEKPQFDSTLGGEETLETRNMNYEEYGESRMLEIVAMNQAMKGPKHTSLIFQEIPRHMRRRVMGHTTKRLPRILREAHRNQLMKGNLLQVKKKPLRKHKRKTRCLLDEFNRRQREFVWLETHLWHAKRFHMIEKWGYKIANFPNDKSFRACYRASSQHCLLQDVSYLCCIELVGPLKELLNGLKCLTQTECGLTFGAKVFLTGLREGNVTLFRHGMFPYGAVGNVNFLWKPLQDKSKQESETEVRTLWIWIHPASYTGIMEELVRTFDLKLKEDLHDEGVPMDVSETTECTSKDVEKVKLATRNVPYTRTPKYENDKGIQMVLLKDTLCRIRLTGPLSQAILADALCIPKRKKKITEGEKSKSKVAKEEPSTITKAPASDIDEIFARMSVPVAKAGPSREIEPQQSSEEEMETDDSKEHDWWTDFYKTKSFYKSILKSQEEFWQVVKEKQLPAELPPHLVIGLTIIDPRVKMPLKRKKSVPDNKYLGNQPRQPEILTPPPHACASAIWYSSIRDIVSQTKASVAELNLRRSKNLIPGFIDEEMEEVSTSTEHSRIPVLLIQRPGCRESDRTRLGFGSGWDIVAPAGWGMPLWMAMIFRGARPSGQREASALRREMLDVDILPPDSMDGRRENDAVREELTEQYFRLPPAKRPNFLKLGMSSPFSCAWDTLTREWMFHTVNIPASCSRGECYTMPGLGPFFILRNKAKLLELKNAVEPRKDRSSDEVMVMPQDHRNCLIPVSVVMVRRGNPEKFSLICAPNEEDLEHFANDGNYFGPKEPQHIDKNAEERKKLRQEHKALLNRLKRKHNKLKKKLENTVNAVIPSKRLNKALNRKRNDPLNKEVVEEYKAKNRHLWLPECSPVKDVCSRLTMGFVSQGEFTFTKGCGAGVGYITFPALVDLMAKQRRGGSKQPLYVLIRSPTTYQYRFATIRIVC